MRSSGVARRRVAFALGVSALLHVALAAILTATAVRFETSTPAQGATTVEFVRVDVFSREPGVAAQQGGAPAPSRSGPPRAGRASKPPAPAAAVPSTNEPQPPSAPAPTTEAEPELAAARAMSAETTHTISPPTREQPVAAAEAERLSTEARADAATATASAAAATPAPPAPAATNAGATASQGSGGASSGVAGGTGNGTGTAGPAGDGRVATGDGAGGGGAFDVSLLHAKLAAAAKSCYPAAARRFRLIGSVPVYFCVDGRGGVERLERRGTSGSELLDRAALECVFARAVPLPGPTQCYPVSVEFR